MLFFNVIEAGKESDGPDKKWLPPYIDICDTMELLVPLKASQMYC